MTQYSNVRSNIGPEAIVAVAAAGVAAFFGTVAAIFAKGYDFNVAQMETTQFGWLTFFSALTTLAIVVAIGMFMWILWTNRGPFVGYAVKVLLGVWGIAISAAVAFIAFRMFYAH